jgi:hypothetical protein
MTKYHIIATILVLAYIMIAFVIQDLQWWPIRLLP